LRVVGGRGRERERAVGCEESILRGEGAGATVSENMSWLRTLEVNEGRSCTPEILAASGNRAPVEGDMSAFLGSRAASIKN
jgi:hypothetical protein